MHITIDLDDGANPIRSVTVDADEHEKIEAVAAKAAIALGIDLAEALPDLGTEKVSFENHDRVGDCIRHGRHWRCHTVCVEVHYQSEPPVRHFFNPKQTWEKVHRWACNKFKVAESVCQDLELFDDSPTGPAINEHSAIGRSQECKHVWLIKPGPEPNG